MPTREPGETEESGLQERITAADRQAGLRVRQRRTELRMSQARLGECLGVTFQQVQKYEKGRNRISVGRLVEIAAVLGRPVGWFLDGSLAAAGFARHDVALPLDRLLDFASGSEITAHVVFTLRQDAGAIQDDDLQIDSVFLTARVDGRPTRQSLPPLLHRLIAEQGRRALRRAIASHHEAAR